MPNTDIAKAREYHRRWAEKNREKKLESNRRYRQSERGKRKRREWKAELDRLTGYNPPPKDWLTTTEVANILGYASSASVCRLIKEGKLVARWSRGNIGKGKNQYKVSPRSVRLLQERKANERKTKAT